MRGVKKSGPPTGDVLGGSLAQRTWVAHRKALRQELPDLSARGVREQYFDAFDKPLVRDRLLVEQQRRCVYCEAALREGGGSLVRVAHWVPIAVDPGRALDWKNLYASCDRAQTCDRRQGGADLGLPEPATLPYEQILRWRADGAVLVGPSAPGRLQPGQVDALRRALGDPDTTDEEVGDQSATLNLNHPQLKRARVGAVKATREHVQKQFRDRTAAPEARGRVASELLSHPKATGFVSVQIAWLERQLLRSAPDAPPSKEQAG